MGLNLGRVMDNLSRMLQELSQEAKDMEEQELSNLSASKGSNGSHLLYPSIASRGTSLSNVISGRCIFKSIPLHE